MPETEPAPSAHAQVIGFKKAGPREDDRQLEAFQEIGGRERTAQAVEEAHPYAEQLSFLSC